MSVRLYTVRCVVICILSLLAAASPVLTAASPASGQSSGEPVILEAEAGTLGSHFEVHEEGGLSYITISSNYAQRPQSLSRVATYEVVFPEAGTYTLYARVRVGFRAEDDDSFFLGQGFGEKDPAAILEWTMVDNLHEGGFTSGHQFVHGRGDAATKAWKWVNLHEFGLDSTTFSVEEGALTQTLQIGGREDGLDIDRLAFGRSDLFYSVQHLQDGESGVSEIPDGEPAGGPLAAGLIKFLGNVYSSSQRPEFEHYWNQVTPENGGKWGSVEPVRDLMNWGALDAAYDLAKSNGFPFRFHVLIWGNQQPTWIASLPVNEQLEEIEEWFAAVAERYPDIDYLEVVNEPLHDPPTDQGEAGSGAYIDALGGTGATGWDWVITAFEMAREHFPGTKLLINEYGILSSSSNVQRYKEIIHLLQNEALIDGIGVQGHAFSTRVPEATIRSNLNELAQTRLPIQVTEFDIDGLTDTQQLQEYQRIFPVLWEHRSVQGITLWGWKPGMWRTPEGAYLVTAEGENRPAFEWLQHYMRSQHVGIERREIPTEGDLRLTNYPNPFSESTSVTYKLSAEGPVSLRVYDSLGRLVRVLADGVQQPGKYAVPFSVEGLAGGVYFCRLEAGGLGDTMPMMLAR